MSFIFHPVKGVDDDVSDATEWYEFQKTGLGQKFIEDWESTANYIISNPFSFSIKHKTLRYANFKVFPYLVVYEIEDDLIIVYSVINAKRHPNKRYVRSNK